MSGVKWIKITTSIFDDDKIKLIESLPEKDTILIIWIKLLVQAGRTNADGLIYLTENMAFTDEMLATVLNRSLASVRLALGVFEKFGMIETNERGILIANWEKHQNVVGLEQIREQNRERVRKFRENQKLITDSSKEKRSKKERINNKDKDIELELESNVTCNVTCEGAENPIKSTALGDITTKTNKKNVNKKANKNNKKDVTLHTDVTCNVTHSTKENAINIPESLNSLAFKEVWQEWKDYRKSEIRKKLTPTAEKRQLSFLANLGIEEAIKSINESMKNGWTGLFEPKKAPAKRGNWMEDLASLDLTGEF